MRVFKHNFSNFSCEIVIKTQKKLRSNCFDLNPVSSKADKSRRHSPTERQHDIDLIAKHETRMETIERVSHESTRQRIVRIYTRF